MNKKRILRWVLISTGIIFLSLACFLYFGIRYTLRYELDESVETGNIAEAEKILQRFPKTISWQDKNGQPIHYVIQTGNIPMIKMLVSHGASVNALTPKGLSPLYLAINFNKPEMVRFLMENGADTRSGMPIMTSLGFAVFRNEVSVVKVLLPYRRLLSQRDYRGSQPLSAAMLCGNPQIVKMLLDAGADVNAVDRYGMSALHKAVSLNRTDCVNLLLEKGANANIATIHPVENTPVYTTPLQYAVANNSIYIARILLVHGADPNIKDGDNKTPIDYAKKYGNINMVKLLESYHQGGNSGIVTQHL